MIEYQDVSKVTSKFVNEFGGDYGISRTTYKEKEQGYGIYSNKDPSEIVFEIFRDALSHMGEAKVYRAAAEAHYQFNNNFGHWVDALVTVRRSKCVIAMHQFPPLH